MTLFKSTCAALGLLAFSNPALAASCANTADALALKTAVIQQTMMVAALQCHDTSAYNRFVLGYRSELQTSDAALKAYFIKRGGEHGEAGYDSFKTRAANLSALEQARDTRGFCADAQALFKAAQQNRGSLAQFVDSRAGTTTGMCIEPKLTEAAIVKPSRPQSRPELVRIADARPAPDKTDPGKTDDVISGVPVHATPAIPHRAAQALPPLDPRDDVASDETESDRPMARPAYATSDDDDLPLPPRPRYTQIRNADDDRAYGPPPGWRDTAPPRYRWYPQNDDRQDWRPNWREDWR